MKKYIFAGLFASLLFSGCSMHNMFGVGYDTSVCNDSKTFGVCGSPESIYKYKDKVKAVQSDYLKARLDTTLYFAVTPEGVIQVKAGREDEWERYDISEWRKIIESRIKEQNKLINDSKERTASVKFLSSDNDIPATKGGDLSVQYKKQGPLLVTRTKIGNIIRDQGLIQEIFIANYADTEGDLISSHEVHVVVRNPEWVVGEKVPKNVKLDSIPTPLSTELIKKQQVVNESQERVINTFNRDQVAGYREAQLEANKEKNENLKDLNLINQFIEEK